MGPFLGFLPKFGHKQIFLEKRALSVFTCSNYLPSCKNQKKLMTHCWEKCRTDRQTDNGDFTGPSLGQGSNKVNFKSYDVTTWLKTIAIHKITNIARSKGNQTLKFGLLIEYNMRNILLILDELFRDPFQKNQNWVYLWINSSKLYSLLLLHAKLKTIKIYWN